MSENGGDGTNRRSVLKGMAGIGTVAVMSPTGVAADGRQEYTLRMGGSSQGSTAFNSMQAVSRALNQHSDTLRMTVEQTQGNVANMYQYDSGNIPAIATDNNTITKAINGADRFEEEPVENIGHQTFRFNGLDIFWVAVEGSGIESTADFPGNTIYPIQPGFGTRLLTEELMRTHGMWDEVEIINVDVGDIPGAISEGRVDALALYGSNRVELTGWAQEVDARNDVYIVEVEDDFRQTIEEVGGARLAEIEPYGWNQDVTKVTDTIVSWNLDLQCLISPEVEAEAAYEFARVSHEHGDTIREADPTYADHSDPEDMTVSIIPEHPVHQGVAEFYRENDVWDDSWQAGGETEETTVETEETTTS